MTSEKSDSDPNPVNGKAPVAAGEFPQAHEEPPATRGIRAIESLALFRRAKRV
jgi:hypothetical protein